jgi:hypothetical protein
LLFCTYMVSCPSLATAVKPQLISSSLVLTGSESGIVTCRPVARQWQRKKQLYDSRYWVTASQTSKQLETATAVRAEMLWAGKLAKWSQLSWAQWRVLSEWVSEWVTELLRFSRCELLLWEAGSWGQGQFGNAEEGECPPLEVAMSNGQWRRYCGQQCVCIIMNCEI